MIIYALLGTFFGIVNGILALFPKGNPPDFIAQVIPTLQSAMQSAGGMSGWIPWGVAATTAGAVFTLWAVLTVISGIRWLVGWIPTMGGS